MIFTKYNSITNSYQQEFVDKCVEHLPDGLDTMCQVTEKIHGANFSFHIDKDEVKVASRNQFVDGGFYGCQTIVDRYKDKVRELYDHMNVTKLSPKWLHVFIGKWPFNCTSLVIYGELAGKGVLSGVDYGDKDFYVFDISVNGDFLDPLLTEDLCKQWGLISVPSMVDRISFRMALGLSPDFKSILKEVGGENWAEGIVIKPIEPAFLPSGQRIIFKKKSDKFVEKGSKVIKVIEPLCDTDVEFVQTIAEYITANRLSNVLSKYGEFTVKDTGKIARLLIEDAIADFDSDHLFKRWGGLREFKRVHKELMRLAVSVILDSPTKP